MLHLHCLSLLQLNPGTARGRSTQILPAICGSFHAIMLQEAHDQTANILAPVPPIHRPGWARHLAQFGHVLPGPTPPNISDRGNLHEQHHVELGGTGRAGNAWQAPGGDPNHRLVLLCPPSTWWQKKRSADTSLLKRFHAQMFRHDVDRIGGQLQT